MPSLLCAGLVATDHSRELVVVGLLSVGCCFSHRAGAVDHGGFYLCVMVVLVLVPRWWGGPLGGPLPVLPMNPAFFPNVALHLLLVRVVTPCFWGA